VLEHGAWNAARLASDAERFTLIILHDADNAGIARQSTYGLHREGRTVLELTASRTAVSQGLHVDMHDALLAVSGAQGLGPVL
jgi:hypothetical protein